MRGTSNGNGRGNTRDRAARRAYLLRAFASDIEGHCRCYRCGDLVCPSPFAHEELTECRLLTVDRIVPGCRGGKYVRANIRPACPQCNSETGGTLARRKKRADQGSESCRCRSNLACDCDP